MAIGLLSFYCGQKKRPDLSNLNTDLSVFARLGINTDPLVLCFVSVEK